MGRKYKMRDFIWNYFSTTGDVEAYLLYKEINPDNTEAEAAGTDLTNKLEDEQMEAVNS
jgi:hypothetical protein